MFSSDPGKPHILCSVMQKFSEQLFYKVPPNDYFWIFRDLKGFMAPEDLCSEAVARGVCEKGVYKNFAKLTGKHLCWSLFFNKVADLRPATLLKKRLEHSCFLVNFGKILRTPSFYKTHAVDASAR